VLNEKTVAYLEYRGKPTFVYVTYITTTIEQLWEAITSDSFVQQYWEEGQLRSDWQVGSPVEQVNSAGE
jgi:uncharacterized protein YndB with AHSA1/START domain